MRRLLLAIEEIAGNNLLTFPFILLTFAVYHLLANFGVGDDEP